MNKTTQSLIRHIITALSFVLGLIGLNKYTGVLDIVTQNLDGLFAAIATVVSVVGMILGFFKNKARLAGVFILLVSANFVFAGTITLHSSPETNTVTTAVKFFKIDLGGSATLSQYNDLRAALPLIPLSGTEDYLVSTRNGSKTASDVVSVLSGISSISGYSFSVTACSTSTVTLYGSTFYYPSTVTFDLGMLSAVENTYSLSSSQAKAWLSVASISKWSNGNPVRSVNPCPFDCVGVFWRGWTVFCQCYYDEENDDEGGW
jgi:hypothetical protein